MSKFSIILPVRNGGQYIKECIASILSQTCKDFNLIVLENFSTDGTAEWLASLDDERIVVIPADIPLSMQENWHRATSIPKNEFMTLIGADDILYPDYLETINRLIKKYPDASLYQTHFRFIDAKGKIVRDCQPVKETETAAEFLEMICFNRTSIIGTGFLMRSADYDSIGGIPMYPNLLFADFELWIELARKSYMATAPEFTFSYRVHLQSTTADSPFGMYAAGFDRLMNYFKKLQKNDTAIASFIDSNWLQFINFYCKGSVHKLAKTSIHKRDGYKVTEVIDQYKTYADEMVPGNHYRPTAKFNIWMAKIIDSNMISRKLFLWFKKIYKKPIYD